MLTTILATCLLWDVSGVLASSCTTPMGPLDTIRNCQPDEALGSATSSRDEIIRIINNLITAGGVLSM